MLVPSPLLFVVYGTQALEVQPHRVLFRRSGATRVRKKSANTFIQRNAFRRNAASL
jgi:hypothetical protein